MINLGVFDDNFNATMKDTIKNKYGIPTLSDEEIGLILKYMDEIEGLDPLSKEYRTGMARVDKIVTDKLPKDWADKYMAWNYVSMLGAGNLTTPVVNLAGNVANVGADIAINPLKRGINKLVMARGGKNVTGKIDYNTSFKGAKTGLDETIWDTLGGKNISDIKNKKDLWESLANPINTNPTGFVGAKFDNRNLSTFNSNIGRVAENTTGFGLSIGDRPFEQAIFDNTVQTLMKNNNLTAPTQEIIDTAREIAKDATFKGSNKFADLLQGSKNSENPFTRAVSTLVMPFVKTPANIAKKGMEYSPIGIAQGLNKLRAPHELSMLDTRLGIDKLARGIVGTGAMGVGGYAGYKGLISPGYEPGTTSRNKSELGYQPSGLNVGGKSFDLKRIAPTTTPFMAGAIAGNKGLGGFGDVLKTSIDTSMLRNINEVTNLFTSNSKYEQSSALKNLLSNMAGQSIPSSLGKLRNVVDENVRNTRSDTVLGGVANRLMNKTPFASNLLPEKFDYTGNTMKTYDGSNSPANVFLNPIKIQNIKNDPLMRESIRLSKQEDNKGDKLYKGTNITKESGQTKVKGIDMNNQQQQQYQKYFYDTANEIMTPMLNSEKYKNMSDEAKAKLLSTVLSRSKAIAKSKLIKNSPKSTSK